MAETFDRRSLFQRLVAAPLAAAFGGSGLRPGEGRGGGPAWPFTRVQGVASDVVKRYQAGLWESGPFLLHHAGPNRNGDVFPWVREMTWEGTGREASVADQPLLLPDEEGLPSMTTNTHEPQAAPCGHAQPGRGLVVPNHYHPATGWGAAYDPPRLPAPLRAEGPFVFRMTTSDV